MSSRRPSKSIIRGTCRPAIFADKAITYAETSSQANHAGIKILDDFSEPLEGGAVGFIEDDEVEETWAELGIAECQRLLGGDEEAFGFVDLIIRVGSMN